MAIGSIPLCQERCFAASKEKNRLMNTAQKIIAAPRKSICRISDHGLWDTTKWAWSHVAARYRKWSLNIETESWVDVDKLGYDPECHGYEPITYARFDSVMKEIEVKPGEDVFLDYGCGKGRALVLASVHPFRRAIGVELSPELCDVARENIGRAGRRLRCPAIEVVNADASRYEVPADVTMIFLWNSFVGQTLSMVVEQIRKSIEKNNRPLTLIYALPQGEKDVMAECDWLYGRRQIPASFWTGIDVFVYQAGKTERTVYQSLQSEPAR
jgi:SAM-dependent methyltransferase